MASVIDIERLIAARTARGWDQKQLAEAAGIDRSVISRLERQLQTDCRLSVLVALASALEIPVAFLIARKAEAEPPVDPALDAAIERLHTQSIPVQRHAALILNAFLDGLSQK